MRSEPAMVSAQGRQLKESTKAASMAAMKRMGERKNKPKDNSGFFVAASLCFSYS